MMRDRCIHIQHTITIHCIRGVSDAVTINLTVIHDWFRSVQIIRFQAAILLVFWPHIGFGVELVNISCGT